MARIKVELAPRLAPTDIGDQLDGFPIIQTVPGGHHALVRLPDTYSAADIEATVRGWLRDGLVVDDGRGLWRFEHTDYLPAWLGKSAMAYGDDVRPLFSAGDTFPLMGITDETRRLGGEGAVRVGIADTWVDANHSFLEGSEIHQYGAGRGPNSDHGTHVTTTAAGREGIARGASLYLANCLPNGSGSEQTVAAGVRWLADQGCEVINMSLGGTVSGVIDDSVRYARQRGAWVCVAAGNGGGQPIGSPARAATVIVMACDRTLRPALFTDGRGWVNPNRVYAVGVDVVAGFPDQKQGVSSGTSMASPQVTGACALLRHAGISEADMLAYLAQHQVAVG